MVRCLLLCMLLSMGPFALAQDVTAFLDHMDRLIAFDRGTFTQIEARKPISLHVGGNYLGYRDNRDDLKVYWGGETKVVDQGSEVEMVVTDHLLGFKIAGILKAFDGKTHLLAPNVGMFQVEDSLILYEDQVQHTINVFYRGRSVRLEDQLGGNAVVDVRTGDNLVAWVSGFDRMFKVWYQGQVLELSDLVTEMDFKCGLDLVAYRDAYDNSFRAFHQGMIYDLETQMPHRYEVGKGVMAWLDLTGSLKVFEGGRVHTVMGYEPQQWSVVDSLVVIQDRGVFNIFADGRLHEVERVVPQKWEASWGTLAYVDVDQSLKIWRHGRTEVLLRGQPVQEFRVDRGLVIARQNINTAKVWWRGKTYDH